MANFPEVRHFKESSNQDNNNIKLLPVRADKGPMIATIDEKLASTKSSLTLTQLVQDELLLGSLEARNLEESSNQDDNYVRLSPVKASKRPKISVTNRKPISGKLLSASTKLALEMG